MPGTEWTSCPLSTATKWTVSPDLMRTNSGSKMKNPFGPWFSSCTLNSSPKAGETKTIHAATNALSYRHNTSMRLHDLLDNRETEPGARNPISLCAPKPLKNPFPLLRRNAISSVGDTYTAVAIHPYRDLLSSRRVDDRVFQQVSQCGFDGICIAAHENRPTSGVETDRAALLDRPRCHCGHDARSDFVEVDNRRYIERDGVEPSDAQQLVHNTVHSRHVAFQLR